MFWLCRCLRKKPFYYAWDFFELAFVLEWKTIVWEQSKENITKQGVQNHCQYKDTVCGVTAEKALF